jgi:hypothetical protein
VAFLLAARARTQVDSQNGSTTTQTDSAFPSNKTAITLLTLHASLCVFWALFAGTPSRDWLDLHFVGIMGFNQYLINPIITIATGIAFAHQARETTRGPSALNRTALLLQAIAFLALAVSWLFRFQVPQRREERGFLWLLQVWYPLVGWACVNNAVNAIGHAFVVYAASGSGGAPDGERQALLNS